MQKTTPTVDSPVSSDVLHLSSPLQSTDGTLHPGPLRRTQLPSLSHSHMPDHGPPTHSTQRNSTDCLSERGFSTAAIYYVAVSGHGSDPDQVNAREHAA
jgi:hypothetical protein